MVTSGGIKVGSKLMPPAKHRNTRKALSQQIEGSIKVVNVRGRCCV
jgi:hypothetical protein